MNVFEQVWNWITDNVVPILSSTTFVTIIGFIVMLLKSRKLLKGNTASNDSLNINLKGALAQITALTNKAEETDKSNKAALQALNSALNAIFEKLSDRIDVLEDNEDKEAIKLNCILSAMRVVYCGGRLDDETTQALNNLFANTEYAQGKTRDDIKAKIKEMEQNMQEFMDKMKEGTVEVRHIIGKDVEPEETETNPYDVNMG